MRVVKWVAGVLAVLLVVGGGLAWWQRESLHVWWVVRGLTRTGHEAWVQRVVDLGEPAIGPLVNRLAEDAEGTEHVAVVALDALARAGHAERVVDQLVKPFPRIHGSNQLSLLNAMAKWDDESRPYCARLLAEVEWDHESPLEPALDLALTMPGDKVREVARAGLRSPTAEVRLKAVRLCLQPGVEMLDQVVGLLRDPSAEVRRAAVLAVGPADQVARDDMLLPGLHDADEEVRKLTEVALTGRGLSPAQLDLARLLTHPAPSERLHVLDRIRDMLEGGPGELDPGAWLRRLSHDPSPAVRAAALRMMTQQSVIDLGDRVDQMARGDPSPTVTQLARYYQGRRR
jgi:predicted NUDIX family NTP pyrophosphohydrolase